jgi:hypothetical protein
LVVIGIVSTLATFGGAAVAYWKPFNPDSRNAILIVLFVLVILVCFLVVPWTQAFRAYKEKADEAESERRRREEAEVAYSLEKCRLLGQLAAPDAARAEYRRLLADGAAILKAFNDYGVYGTDREPGRKEDMLAWCAAARTLFRSHAIDRLADFLDDPDGEPEPALLRLQGAFVGFYFDRKLGALKRLLGPLIDAPAADGAA